MTWCGSGGVVCMCGAGGGQSVVLWSGFVFGAGEKMVCDCGVGVGVVMLFGSGSLDWLCVLNSFFPLVCICAFR